MTCTPICGLLRGPGQTPHARPRRRSPRRCQVPLGCPAYSFGPRPNLTPLAQTSKFVIIVIFKRATATLSAVPAAHCSATQRRAHFVISANNNSMHKRTKYGSDQEKRWEDIAAFMSRSSHAGASDGARQGGTAAESWACCPHCCSDSRMLCTCRQGRAQEMPSHAVCAGSQDMLTGQQVRAAVPSICGAALMPSACTSMLASARYNHASHHLSSCCAYSM